MATDTLPRSKAHSLPRTNSHSLPSKKAAPEPFCIPLQQAHEEWVNSLKAQGCSRKTLQDRIGFGKRLAWWFREETELEPTLENLTRDTVRRFLSYCREPNERGRFGCSHAKTAAKPHTLATYHRDMKAFTRFCLTEGLVDVDPLTTLKAPRVPEDNIEPFTEEQIQALLDATARTAAPLRNRCILLLLLDTGMRLSELTSLRVGDMAYDTGQVTVVGKGNKQRTVYLGQLARKTVRTYLRRERATAKPDAPLFVSVGGNQIRGAFGPAGVRQMVEEVGKLGGVRGVRCSPHTFRHTFCISFLRNGGNLFELQNLVGHATLDILRRYVKLAQADVKDAHRRCSPADNLKLK